MVVQVLLAFTALAAVAQRVAAHTIVVGVWVNDQDKSDYSSVGTASSYMRAPSSNSPVTDLTSASLACNDKGTTEVSGYLEVAPGDTIEPQWWHSGDIGSDPIAASHVGPLTTWISPYDDNTSGDVWVEIASEAYYDEAGEWAVTKMIANKGRNTVTVPSDLAPGNYLVRFDLLALHSASSAGGAQFYPNCAQIKVTGSGSTALPAGVSIPGFFTESTPGIVWNIYYSTDYNVTGDYIAPGTGVWDGTSTYSTDTCEQTVDGLAPAGYCQGGSNTSTPSTTSKAASTSTAVATSSAAASTSKAVSSPAASSSVVASASSAPASSTLASFSAVSTTSQALYASSSAASPSSALASPTVPAVSTTSGAGSSTSSAIYATYTDYSSCMRAYNKCIAAAQPTAGGAADFSGCNSQFNNCSAYQRRFRRSHRRPVAH
ncbi:hypothetical protein JCM1840_003319 [Sporobolomyces johnsonii]